MILRHIYISGAHNFFGHHGRPEGTVPAVDVDEAEVVAGKGLVGDRFFGFKDDYAGQVTFFSIETHESLCARLGVWDRDASVYRRNLIVEGADLNVLIGREFELQGVRFLGVAEAKPCHWMEQAFGAGAEAALDGSGGLRAKVLTSGVLRRQTARAELRPGPAEAGTPCGATPSGADAPVRTPTEPAEAGTPNPAAEVHGVPALAGGFQGAAGVRLSPQTPDSPSPPGRGIAP